MAQSREHKAQTRERILAQASERLRADGLSGVSITQLMTAAGVTHGGFYRHFDSREDLIAQATERALREGAAAGARARAGQPPTLAAYVKSYLSRTHRDAPERGCAIAALAADVPHAGALTSEVFTEGLMATLERLAAQFAARGAVASGGSSNPEPMDEAIALLSSMVGALVLSRAVKDGALSDRILAVNRSRLIDDVT